MSKLTERHFPILDQLRQFKPKFLRDIPSACSILARFLNRLISVILSSLSFSRPQKLYTRRQRTLIEDVFHGRVFDCLWPSERRSLLVNVINITAIIFFLNYGILELLKAMGIPVEKEGEVGRVVWYRFL